MNNNDFNEVFDILSGLLNELVTEEEKLKEIIKEHSFKIDEINQQIDICKKNEDIDFRVFSPRNVSFDNSEKITSLESQCSDFTKEKNDAEKRLLYYSGKVDKLRRALNIIRKDSIEYDDNKKIEDGLLVERDPFDYLFNDDISDSSDELFRSNITKKEKTSVDSEKADVILEDSSEFIDSNEKASDVKTEISDSIPVEEVKRVCHKVEFSEKILSNDRVRAKMELKDVISDLKELIRVYSKNTD